MTLSICIKPFEENLRIIIPCSLLIILSFPLTILIDLVNKHNITCDNFLLQLFYICYPFTLVCREIALEHNVSCCIVSDMK